MIENDKKLRIKKVKKRVLWLKPFQIPAVLLDSLYGVTRLMKTHDICCVGVEDR